ncbi:MAG: hypothetical protein Kow0090_17060 [Myxococcota bacterium]
MNEIKREDRLIGEGLCKDSDYQWYIYERRNGESTRIFLLTIDGPISGSFGDVPTNIWAEKFSSIAQAMEVGMDWFPEKFLDRK